MLQSIRALRGVAALLVVVYHACEYARTHGHPDMQDTFLLGAIGVDIFFVISGYVMLLALEKTIHASDSPLHLTTDFLVRRVIRIAPIYWLGTSFLYLIFVIQPDKFRHFSASPEGYWQSMLFLPTTATHGKSTISPILSQGWTLYHEFFFYSILSALLIFNVRKGIRLFAPLLVVLLCLAGAQMQDTQRPWVELITNPINIEFAFGCLLYMLPKIQANRLTATASIVGMIALAFFLNSCPDFSKTRDFNRVLYWGTTAAALFWLCCSAEPYIQKWGEGFSKRVGDPSYSIYIFHGLAFSGADLLLKKLHVSVSPILFVCVLCASSIVACNVIYHLIELPMTQRLNRLWANYFRNPIAK